MRVIYSKDLKYDFEEKAFIKHIEEKYNAEIISYKFSIPETKKP